jgi:hypothetical protein
MNGGFMTGLPTSSSNQGKDDAFFFAGCSKQQAAGRSNHDIEYSYSSKRLSVCLVPSHSSGFAAFLKQLQRLQRRHCWLHTLLFC